MKPKELVMDEKLVVGVGVRTKNEKEMNPEKAQLPGKLEKGRYLIFEAKGEIPRVVIETWKNISYMET